MVPQKKAFISASCTSPITGKVRFPFSAEFRKCYLIQSPHIASPSFHTIAVSMLVSLLLGGCQKHSVKSHFRLLLYLGLRSFVREVREKQKKRLIVLHFILCIKTNNKQDKYLQDMLITFACHNVVWKFLFVMNLVLLLWMICFDGVK